MFTVNDVFPLPCLPIKAAVLNLFKKSLVSSYLSNYICIGSSQENLIFVNLGLSLIFNFIYIYFIRI